ncbi:MAG TPA: radical SAM protein [Terriglobales bacterium]|nr:radical SAM protein [Terriglobales bacterium]
MSGQLMMEIGTKALELGVPLSAHFDLTWRCNERCIHCYLDHEDRGEVTTTEVKDILEQLAAAGTFFLILSGGEPVMRKDFFEIVEYARQLMFSVKVKTNGILIREREAARLRELAVEVVQISVYSHRAAVHDAITKVPGSLERTLNAVRFLRGQGLKVIIAGVMMRQNLGDHKEVQKLARELGVSFQLDPTITPKLDGDTSVLDLRIPDSALPQLFRDGSLVGDADEFCAPAEVDASALEALPCSAGHTAVYISPYADVFPCVQFPLPTGNLRQQKFLEVWRDSPQMNEVRGIRLSDLHACSSCGNVASCSRCPGLAYMEGDMRGPSSADCDKSFARTGILSPRKRAALVQIAI